MYTHTSGIGGKRYQVAERIPTNKRRRSVKYKQSIKPFLKGLRTTVHSSLKETTFERHYGRKPRTEIHLYLKVSSNKLYTVSAKPETLQVYSFTNGNRAYDQLAMKSPRKLKEDVVNNFLYLFLEKKHNRVKFGSMYENKPQTAVAGTKHISHGYQTDNIQKKGKQTTKPNISDSLITTGRKLEGKGRKIYTTRTTGRKQHNGGTLREMQYTGVIRKCIGQYTGNGEHHTQPGVRQRPKTID